jgi:hypothetical protein
MREKWFDQFKKVGDLGLENVRLKREQQEGQSG